MQSINISGTKLFVSNENRFKNFWTHFNSKNWEKPTLDILLNNLSTDDIYIDVGAWVGPTVLAASVTNCIVHAYEPDPVAFNELLENIQLNKIGNIQLHNIALFDRSGEMFFGPGRGDEMGESISSLMNGAGTVAVVVRDVADEIKKSHFLDCKLIKMDIEGAEYIVIHKMKPLLIDKKPILLLSVHGMKTAGYSGVLGFLKMMRNRMNLLNLLNIYNEKYIESRSGWLDSNAHWVKFTIFKKINFVLSARGNRELLLSSSPVNMNAND
jgi:FkbM family methyltransferase